MDFEQNIRSQKLLTPEEENTLFKTIEQCEKNIWISYTYMLPAMYELVKQYDLYKKGQIKLHDIVRIVTSEHRENNPIIKPFANIKSLIQWYEKKSDNDTLSVPHQKKFSQVFFKQVMDIDPNKKILENIYKTILEDYNDLVTEQNFIQQNKNTVENKIFIIHLNNLIKIIRKYKLSPIEFKRKTENIKKNIELINQCKNKIITSSLYIVIIFARKYYSGLNKFQDLVQEGCIGLINAVDKFKYSRGYRFSTYAVWWIKQAIARAALGRLIHIPSYLFETASKVKKEIIKNQLDSDEIPDPKKIAESTEIPVERISTALQCTGSETVSLDLNISDTSKMTFSDFLKDETDIPSGKKHDETILKDEIRSALSILTTREEFIIVQRYGLDGKQSKTLEEIGAEMGLTRERIRQLEAQALKKLRHPVYGRILASIFAEKNLQ